jgi:hypothetical protein
MTGTIKRLLVGATLTAAVVVSAGSPVLAANGVPHASRHGSAPASSKPRPSKTTPSPGRLDIGTAAQWVRGTDGTVHQVQ